MPKLLHTRPGAKRERVCGADIHCNLRFHVFLAVPLPYLSLSIGLLLSLDF